MLFAHAIKKFLKHMNLIERSQETIRGYRLELGYFNNFLEVKYNCPVYVEDVVLEDIEDYLLYEKKRGIASSSRSRSVYILRSFYNHCIKKDIAKKNIANLIEPVKIKQKEPNFITKEEFEQLTAAIEQPIIRTAVQTMFYTGGRISEIINLKLEDVDLKNKIIHIIEGKGNKDRDIPINNRLHKVLTSYLKNIRKVNIESSNFFAIKRTGSVSASYINKEIREAVHKIGLEKVVSAHILRHSFGSNLLEKGASVVSIQKLLGHSDLRVTSRYLHQDMEKLSDAVNLL